MAKYINAIWYRRGHLDGVPFISLYREHMTYYRLARPFADADCNVAAETHFIATCYGFVANGAGVALVDPITATHYEGKGLVTRRFVPVVPYELGLISPIDRAHSRRAEAFVGTFKESIVPFLDSEPQYGERTRQCGLRRAQQMTSF